MLYVLAILIAPSASPESCAAGTVAGQVPAPDAGGATVLPGGSTAARANGSNTTVAVPAEACANEPASSPVNRAVQRPAAPGSIVNVAAKPRGPIDERNCPPDEPTPANLPAAGAIWTSRRVVSTPAPAVPWTTMALPSTTGGSAVMSGTVTGSWPATVTVSPGRICGTKEVQHPVAVPASARWKELT